MIGKKMLTWAAAGLLSVGSIPAIAATHAHRAKATHHIIAKIHTAAKKPLAAKRTHLLTARHVTARKHAVVVSHHATTKAGTGIQSMHSGHVTLAKAPVLKKTAVHAIAVKHTAAKPMKHHTLAAATVVVRK